MARENYDFCIKEVLKSEGGYTNDPVDPGGPTNYGITLHDYRAYINHAGTAKDVKNMTVDQAKAIYKAKYWDTVDGDHLPSGVDYCVFDYGVNSGISRANRVYNNLRSDEPDTPETSIRLIDNICDERMRFLRNLPTFYHFGKGWTARVEHVRKDSKWLTIQMKNSPQPPMQSLTTSLLPSPSKESHTSWLKTSFMGWFKGNAPTV